MTNYYVPNISPEPFNLFQSTPSQNVITSSSGFRIKKHPFQSRFPIDLLSSSKSRTSNFFSANISRFVPKNCILSQIRSYFCSSLFSYRDRKRLTQSPLCPFEEGSPIPPSTFSYVTRIQMSNDYSSSYNKKKVLYLCKVKTSLLILFQNFLKIKVKMNFDLEIKNVHIPKLLNFPIKVN